MVEDEEIKELRKQIDSIDSELIRLYAERWDLIIEVGKIKKKKNIPIQDKKREDEVLSKVKKEAKKYDLDENKIEGFWKCIIDCATNEQERLCGSD